MSHQDWTPVVIKRASRKAKAQSHMDASHVPKHADALDMTYLPKKYVASESLQELIKKRIEMSLNQENADKLCSFPVNTFKKIESKQLIPTPTIQMAVQKKLGVQLKIETSK
jgi:uncharacterized protein YlzI (FlbEa/FlbD family)